MKNVILGMIGAMIALYMAVLSLGIYGIYARKDELDNSLAEVMESVMLQHYHAPAVSAFLPEADEAAVSAEIEEELALRLTADSKLTVEITTCDMQQGVLAVRVKEEFMQPNGKTREITAEKVLIADGSS